MLRTQRPVRLASNGERQRAIDDALGGRIGYFELMGADRKAFDPVERAKALGSNAIATRQNLFIQMSLSDGETRGNAVLICKLYFCLTSRNVRDTSASWHMS